MVLKRLVQRKCILFYCEVSIHVFGIKFTCDSWVSVESFLVVFEKTFPIYIIISIKQLNHPLL